MTDKIKKASGKPVYKRPGRDVEEAGYVSSDDPSSAEDYYSEIINFLTEAIKQDPNRQDIRIKLLDVYYDTGNGLEFEKLASEYAAQIKTKNDPMWKEIYTKGQSLRPEASIFGGDDGREKPIEKKPGFKRFGDNEDCKPFLENLAKRYHKLRTSSQFFEKLDIELMKNSGRPSPWLHCKNLSAQINGAQIFLKREDLNTEQPRLRTHLTGQAWVAKNLGIKKVIFAASNGDEAVIAARAAACAELKCSIYISATDGMYREIHKFQAQLMGSEFIETIESNKTSGVRELVLAKWIQDHENIFMMLNLNAGPHPYPIISIDMQAAIGRECIRQVKGKLAKMPIAVFSRSEPYADAIGFVEPFLGSKETEIFMISTKTSPSDLRIRLESEQDQYHLLTASNDKKSKSLSTDHLNYPHVNREHSLLKATGRLKYDSINLQHAKSILKAMAKSEGIILPVETAHVVAYACTYAKHQRNDEAIVIMLAEKLSTDFLLAGS